jgi:hypothetical protein
MNDQTLLNPKSDKKRLRFARIRGGLSWRMRLVQASIRRGFHKAFGVRPAQWARVVMDQNTYDFASRLDTASMDALEISGAKWSMLPFRSFRSVQYPDFDICNGVLGHSCFDIVFAEQVLEHVRWPFRAVTNVYDMLRPNGWFVVTTPFLLRLHPMPNDCTRWSAEGLRYFLGEAGFNIDMIQTGSWGNRACVKGNFRKWVLWTPWLHSLRNEPDFPVVVWAFARK